MKIDQGVFEKSAEQKRYEKKIIIGKKKTNKNNKVFRWKRKTLIKILDIPYHVHILLYFTLN